VKVKRRVVLLAIRFFSAPISRLFTPRHTYLIYLRRHGARELGLSVNKRRTYKYLSPPISPVSDARVVSRLGPRSLPALSPSRFDISRCGPSRRRSVKPLFLRSLDLTRRRAAFPRRARAPSGIAPPVPILTTFTTWTDNTTAQRRRTCE